MLASKPCGLALAAGLTLGAAAAPSAAQPLSSVACPNGGPTYVPFAMQRFQLGDPGTPMLRVTLNGPNSRCNDGTPAIMYIRPPAANYNGSLLSPADYKQERWVIQFQGGGGCRDAASCYERWCGLTGIDRAAAMSTNAAYGAIPGTQGIWKRNPAVNAFAGYNQVWLRYCSSDNWIGSDSHAGLAGTGGVTYDIEFNGEAIVNDAFDRLLAPGGVGPDPNPFWSDRLPSLVTAEEIILVGDSAGGNGLRHHLDRLAERLRNEVLGDVRIMAVIDAGNPPGYWNTPLAWGATPDAPISYADLLTNEMEDTTVDLWGADDSALDASCLDPAYAAAHVADGGSHPQVCYDTTYTLFNHITTPFFVRQDINDPLGREKYMDWQMFSSLPPYWAAQRSFLTGLVGYAGGLEPIAVAPGVFVPNCALHVSINADSFFTHAVRFPGPVAGASFHDLVVAWRMGAPAAQIQADGIPGPAFTPSICPP